MAPTQQSETIYFEMSINWNFLVSLILLVSDLSKAITRSYNARHTQSCLVLLRFKVWEP